MPYVSRHHKLFTCSCTHWTSWSEPHFRSQAASRQGARRGNALHAWSGGCASWPARVVVMWLVQSVDAVNRALQLLTLEPVWARAPTHDRNGHELINADGACRRSRRTTKPCGKRCGSWGCVSPRRECACGSTPALHATVPRCELHDESMGRSFSLVLKEQHTFVVSAVRQGRRVRPHSCSSLAVDGDLAVVL